MAEPTERTGLKSDQVEIAMVDPKAPPDKALLPGRARTCSLPILFERASHSWWNPRFDSNILEAQHLRSALPQSQQRFRFALGYVALSCAVWCTVFGVQQHPFWVAYVAGTAALLAVMLVMLGFSFTRVHARCMLPTSIVVTLILCLFNLLGYIHTDAGSSLSEIGLFVGAVEIIMLMYTLIPLPLYVCVGAGVCYSIVFEALYATTSSAPVSGALVACRVLLHFCVHIIGTHVFIMSQVRKHSTFLKVGQSILARRHLQVEKQQKRHMIHSLMPPKVAEEVMKAREDRDRDAEENDQSGKSGRRRRSSQGGSGAPEKGKIVFRTFHMSQLDNVTILYADIVGFTKMSSNKSAVLLVRLLNDLFGRFDDICQRTGCEKISTLGDCYYCVSGCPEPRPDHARCCVEMGRQMCVAIKEFDEEHNEEVNMRVGVHTGTVLCGLVGTRRFKFDVWSHDVTLANMMESEGRPGRVHVSDMTYNFIKDQYTFEEGDPVEDLRKNRRLVEDYNTETQQYRVRHVETTNNIRTWYVVEPPVVENGTAVIKASPAPAVDGEVAGEDTHANQSDGRDLSAVGLLKESKEISTVSKTEEINGEVISNPGSGPPAKLSGDAQDSEMISAMTECPDLNKYLYRPQVNPFLLHFTTPRLERDYRRHYLDDTGAAGAIQTFALPRISSVLDVIVSIVFYVVVAICCIVALNATSRIVWVVVFIVGLVIQIAMLIPMLCDVWGRAPAQRGGAARCGRALAGWYPRHAFGGVVASLPTLVVYAAFCCEAFGQTSGFNGELFFCLFLITSLLAYCNFTILSSWMKSVLAILAAVVLIILLCVGVCSYDGPPWVEAQGENVTVTAPLTVVWQAMTVGGAIWLPPGVFSGQHTLSVEVIVDVALFLLLIWFLNREIEIGYRLCYHGDVQAVKDRRKIETEKEQADWLLHNIVPEHVADHMKHAGNFYCKNHKEVGVIFAKVSNFDDFYDESFEGGKEYLRVLNELLGDFEDLFDQDEFRDIEKIKTIGSCLMAASGLNPQTHRANRNPNAHLYALMDFSLAVLKKIEAFNAEMFNFEFEMSIGYNFGEVTAGVIGTTKLLYDIWGDTVNIASRMYSTGVHQRIQVTQDVAERLGDMFDFEYRGQTFVKGKGDMNTYLLVGKKPGAKWD